VAKTIRSSKNPADYKSLHLQKFTKRKAGVLTPPAVLSGRLPLHPDEVAAGEAATFDMVRQERFLFTRRFV